MILPNHVDREQPSLSHSDLGLVAHYLDQGLALVPVPSGGKRPAAKGWQHKPVTTLEAARRGWRSGCRAAPQRERHRGARPRP